VIDVATLNPFALFSKGQELFQFQLNHHHAIIQSMRDIDVQRQQEIHHLQRENDTLKRKLHSFTSSSSKSSAIMMKSNDNTPNNNGERVTSPFNVHNSTSLSSLIDNPEPQSPMLLGKQLRNSTADGSTSLLLRPTTPSRDRLKNLLNIKSPRVQSSINSIPSHSSLLSPSHNNNNKNIDNDNNNGINRISITNNSGLTSPSRNNMTVLGLPSPNNKSSKRSNYIEQSDLFRILNNPKKKKID